ncbi:AAA family ATPase [Bradyrhizobium sp. 137]|uniref:adenylate/guanylate cyclase domain-containing protein n=1 Tax=Bradyrhizobium sp. 137 TaxID=2782614 RepID=UPI001FFA1492|nr:adenylate/guanylate cyclase domain-containing protein [Bradyrhizobium sp. 137]MCK1755350.1 AAA family ATPase [Bradyrhizobium sp. 137]
MQSIAHWLHALGFEQYAQRFAENEIDVSVLPHLTDQDLKDIGIPLGHRRKILAAISERTSAAQVASSAASMPSKTSDAAERRQLTVMFVDLVGSTALSGRLDPEELRDIIGAYHRRCAEVITRSGGFVAKYLGDGVLAYFGYPQAHEEDAEQSVRTGLALIEAVAKLDAGQGTSLQVRVGIATGLVVVGDLLGEGAAQEQSVIGETPNLAARLQGLAEPNTVVIADGTRRMLGGLFEYRDLGPLAIAGMDRPVQVWRVLGAGQVGSRFEALRAASTPLIGREEEIALLTRRWERAKAGDGSVVLIVGEPGIGKSRIAQTLLEQLGEEPHTRLRYFCSPHHQHSALYPSITQLEQAAGFRREDTAETRLDKLVAALALANQELGEAVPLLADLLSIPTGDRYPPLNLSPQKRKEKTLQVQVAQVTGLAAQQPLLMLWEDIHWSDPTTLESLDLLIDRAATLRVLVILTFRPEFTPPWVGRPHVTLLSLNRLPPRHRAEMIAHVTGGKTLPREIADQIIDRTDGVPLFIEELTKFVLESGRMTDAGDHRAIPTTLQASLLARLDRLAPVREVAQIGAALGRQFSHELISAVSRMPPQELEGALARLVRAELIFRRGTPPDAEYTFKHALVQDAVYSTLLRARRQQLHANIVRVLEEQFPGIGETHPELLAHHCTRAGLIEKGVAYRHRAGRHAMARSAMIEAVAQLAQGLELSADLPAGDERDQLELDVQVALGAAFVATKGFAALEVGRAYERARELCRQRADHPELPAVLWGLYVHHMHRSGVDVGYEFAEELLRLAEHRRDPAACAVGHRCLAVGAMHRGNQRLALAHFELALAPYDRADHRSPVFLSDLRVASLNFIPLILLWRGEIDQAIARSRAAFAAAQELGDAYTLSHVFHLNCWLYQHLGDSTTVRERAEAAMKLTAEHGFPLWEVCAAFWYGWAFAAAGEVTAGSAQMRSALAAKDGLGVVNQVPFLLGVLADICTQAGDSTEARDLLTEALGIVDRTQERWFEAELHRLRAEALLASSPSDSVEAEASLRHALAVAREQEARFWELRAATSLARLWRDHDKRIEARDLLAPIYGSFTEGFDTRYLKEAAALLAELA